jgi:hypothetical protein
MPMVTRRLLPLAFAVCAAWQPAAAQHPAGTWRIAEARMAPWAASRHGPLPNTALRGRTIEFTEHRVAAPQPLGCARGTYEYVVTPAEGLFQGVLGETAAEAARALGIRALPVLTLQVTCDAGRFDYHFVARDTLLTALDDVVWTLVPVRQPNTPAAAVLWLLQTHLTGDMGFSAGTAAARRSHLSPELYRQIEAYFAQPFPEDEPPPINGDPITDSQEYPSRFTFGGIRTTASRSLVTVHFGGNGYERPVIVLLRRMQGRWLVDDLRYEDGTTFREALKPE